MVSLLYTQIYMSSCANTLFVDNITQVWKSEIYLILNRIIWCFLIKGQSSVAFIKAGCILVNESTASKVKFYAVFHKDIGFLLLLNSSC